MRILIPRAMMDARGSLLSSTADELDKQGPVDYQFYHGPIHTRKFAHKLASGTIWTFRLTMVY